MEVTERVLREEPADTLTSRNNLAEAYRLAGRHEEAIRVHEKTLEARERVLGEEHPDTLSSRNGLAIAYRAAGRNEDAEGVLRAEYPAGRSGKTGRLC